MSLQKQAINAIVIFLSLVVISFLIFIFIKQNKLTNKFEAFSNNQSKIDTNIEKFRSDFLQILSHNAGSAKTDFDVTSAQAASAVQSLDKGRDAVKQGEYDLAITYFLNGVNHDPGNIDLLNEVADTALLSRNPQLISQAQGVLELSVYQVPSKDMINILNLVAKLSKVSSPIAPEPPSKERIEINAKNVLNHSNPLFIWQHNQTIIDSISEIQGILDQSKNILSSDIVNALTERLQILNAVSNISPVVEFLENAIEILKKEANQKNPSRTLVESILSSVNSKLMILWGINMSNIPVSIQQEVKEYPQKVSIIVKNIQEKDSAEIYQKLKEVLDTAESLNEKKYTDTINSIQAKLQYVNENLVNITYSDHAKEIRKKYLEVEKRIMGLKQDRFQAYQKWVLERCQEAYRSYHETKIFNDDDAIATFLNSNLRQIDQALLMPEVSRIFNNVIQKIIGELPGAKAFEIDKQMAEANKKTLEDF